MMPSVDHQHSFDFRLKRTIHVRKGSSSSAGPLTVGPIEWMPDRQSWACYWSVHVIDPEGHRFYGDDPIQALNRTLEFIARLIHGSIEDGFVIWWQYEGDAGGFSPKT